jgi:hypothetical protein
MKRLTRIKLASAVAAALVGGMGAPLQVSANPALHLQTSSPGRWANHNQLGDALLFPFYTVKNDPFGNSYQTSFTITNTDPDNTVIIKFRLRDHVNSDDVLDFIWILSPGDEVVGWMDRGPNGRPRLNIPQDDKTCRVPLVDPTTGDAHSYISPTEEDNGPPLANAVEGHLEVIPIAALPAKNPSNTYDELTETIDGRDAVHGSGQNCEAFDTLFGTAIDGSEISDGLDQSSGVPQPVNNVLRGSYAIYSPASGYAGGGDAIPLRYWGRGGGEEGVYLFAQNGNPAEPTRIDGSDDQQFDHPHLGDSSSTQSLDISAISAGGIVNNWSVNPTNGAGVDWVATYFTKYLYRDVNGFYGAAGGTLASPTYEWPVVDPAASPVYNPAVKTTPPWAGSPWNTTKSGSAAAEDADTPNGGTCVSLRLGAGHNTVIRDRDEATKNITGSVSPGGGGTTLKICDEATVLSFKQSGKSRIPVLRADDDEGTVLLTVDAALQPYGWADVEVNPYQYTDGTEDNSSVAVGGLSYTLRNLGDPSTAYGAIRPHTLVRVPYFSNNN